MAIQIKNNAEKVKRWLIEKLNNFFSDRDPYFPISEQKRFWISSKLLLLIGYVYHTYKVRQENLRVTIYKLRDDFTNAQILYEIWLHSQKLLSVILLTFLVSGSIYFVLAQPKISLLTHQTIESILLAYFAGVTTILGIIFAFYSVGFQIATTKFSSEVTDYMNREKVGRFFFNLLVTVDVLTLILLITQYSVTTPLITAFFIITIFVIFSLLGILVFKDDYITKLKSRSIFDHIYNENLQAIRLVNEYHIPEINSFTLTRNPNIKSFKLYLNTRESWKIVMTLQNNIEKRLRIHEVLFQDLVKEGAFEDASYGIKILGYFLDSYIEIKHFIDTDRPWWFPTYQELVTADNMSMFPLKANYESMGIGRLGITKSKLDWLENVIVRQIEAIQNNDTLLKQLKIVSGLNYTYETILAGRFERTELGLQKSVRGIYELQDFELTERVLNLFFILSEKITDEDIRNNYIEALGQIKTTIADGFSQRDFPGKLIDWKLGFNKLISGLIQNSKVVNDKSLIINEKPPKYFYQILIDYLERLEAEQFVEGKLITPKTWLIDELTKNAENKEKEIREKFLFSLLDGMFNAWEKSTDDTLRNSFNLIIFGLFNQLISADEWVFLEAIIIKYKSKLFTLLLKVESTKFIELELREPIEFGVFNALLATKKVVFDFYNSMFFVSQIHLVNKIDRTNVMELFKLGRRPLILGALAYVVSELKNDFHYVEAVSELSKTLFPKADLSSVFNLTKDTRFTLGTNYLFQIINEETNRYNSYFMRMMDSIFELPEDWITHGGPPYGMASVRTVKHKSSFIRELASSRYSDMEECFDGYIKWLEKQESAEKNELTMKLISTLQALKNKYEKD